MYLAEEYWWYIRGVNNGSGVKKVILDKQCSLLFATLNSYLPFPRQCCSLSNVTVFDFSTVLLYGLFLGHTEKSILCHIWWHLWAFLVVLLCLSDVYFYTLLPHLIHHEKVVLIESSHFQHNFIKYLNVPFRSCRIKSTRTFVIFNVFLTFR